MTGSGDTDATVALTDRGFAYGDGLFETVLVRDGVPLLWDEHCARLAQGAHRLGFEPPAKGWLDALPAKAPRGKCVLKIVLTRGSGGRGYRPPLPAEPRCYWQFTSFTPMPERWERGVSVRLCQLRLARQPALAGLKHLNRLENVLARQEWQDDAIAEGLLLNDRDQLVEATAMNLAWFDQGQWWTPELIECGVEGTLRRALIDQGHLSIARASDAPLSRFLNAPSTCLFNSVQGLWPIVRCLDAQHQHVHGQWPIDDSVRRLQGDAHALLGYPSNFPIF
ncbi:aminodeoxychorismate lyase [Kushneria marisflavi]|uniref:Aminodeoxychorismate lyase n=1 Tax=Kushneria marisflavi TaxID=157779 RepID=A0A240ULB4_9GAMM|nr:aminodeoxychorismate lyase [Kushneria marisflavi]ART61809.1 aminodeoxychorismate lyase [Kushneria marisflavi]RKD86842.1 aminodeoxychorismate lyase apoprotein [Kushneria marisflavi]